MPGTHAGSNCKLKRSAVYVRRRPERSEAYQVVLQNLETWLAQRRAGRLVAGAFWYLTNLKICGSIAMAWGLLCYPSNDTEW